MQVVYLNGRRLQITWRELRLQFRHPYFVGMMMLMGLSIILIGPYNHLLNFGPLRLTLFYAACFGSFTSFLYALLWLCHRMNWPAYSLFTVGGAGLGATLCGLLAALLLGAPLPSLTDMALVTGFNLVFCYLGETLQSTYVIPRILPDLRNSAAQDRLGAFIESEGGALSPLPAESPPPAHVHLFGQTFATHQLYLLEAEEHYVAVVLRDGTRTLLRGRIADAVAVLHPDLGRRVHRSYWVAAAAVVGFRPDRSGAHLILTQGDTVPVARPRMPEVRRWAESLKPTPTPANRKAPQRVPPVDL